MLSILRHHEKGLLSFSLKSLLSVSHFFFLVGLRTFHPNWDTSPPSRRFRNRLGLHVHHRQIAASRHPTRGQESHPGMPQRPPRHPS